MIYWAGGVQFLITGVANGGLIPSTVKFGKNCALKIAKWNILHNQLLKSKLEELKNELSDIKIVYADIFSSMTDE